MSENITLPLKNDAKQTCWGGLGNAEAYYGHVMDWISQDTNVMDLCYEYFNENQLEPSTHSNLAIMFNDTKKINEYTAQHQLHRHYFNIIKIMVIVTVNKNYFGTNKTQTMSWTDDVMTAVEQWAKILPVIRKHNLLWDSLKFKSPLGSNTDKKTGITLINGNKNMFMVSHELLDEWDNVDDYLGKYEPANDEYKYDAGWFWEFQPKTGQLKQVPNYQPVPSIDLNKLNLQVEWVDVDTYFFELRLRSAGGETLCLLQSLEYIWLYFGLTPRNHDSNDINIPKRAQTTNAANNHLQKLLSQENLDETQLNNQQQKMVNGVKKLNNRCTTNQNEIINESNELLLKEYIKYGQHGQNHYKLQLGKTPLNIELIEDSARLGMSKSMRVWHNILSIMQEQLCTISQFIANNSLKQRVSVASRLYHIVKPLCVSSKHVIYLYNKYDIKQSFVLYLSQQRKFNQKTKFTIQIPLFQYNKKLFFDCSYQDVVFWFDLYIVSCHQWTILNVHSFANWWQVCNVFSQLYFWHSVFNKL